MPNPSAGKLHFSKTRRIRRAVDFQLLSKSGLKVQDPFFTVLGRLNEHVTARLGITVSRRVSTRAVLRNRVKRQIRESFRHYHNELGVIDVVVIARSAVIGVANSVLQESLQKHWKNIQKQCRPFSLS